MIFTQFPHARILKNHFHLNNIIRMHLNTSHKSGRKYLLHEKAGFTTLMKAFKTKEELRKKRSNTSLIR